MFIMDSLEAEIGKIDSSIEKYANLTEIKNLQVIPDIGLFSVIVIYPEIGDILRFRDSSYLVSYSEMIPSVRQSSDVVHYGRITYEGSRYPRWIIVEALRCWRAANRCMTVYTSIIYAGEGMRLH